ncbi:Hypothetical predicted protein [Octopus vulgaris]|uniref:Uncharacterized protein n=1 Tax=Octopus vulgaris TaxID=6645 RepID=A0AA36BSW7_OCTVU|nr:Hypothetical predicted protein [Octopus vulgaris]
MLESEGKNDTKPNEVPEMVECNGNLEICEKTSDCYKTAQGHKCDETGKDERHLLEEQDNNFITLCSAEWNLVLKSVAFVFSVCLKGYGRKEPVNPQFMTTSSEYGSIPPSIHTVPQCFYPKTLQFTKNLRNAGMYRNRSLNTALDKSYV